jgi:hypothetical protein
MSSVAGEFDLVDALASGLEDRHRALDFIERFVAAWHQPLVATDGWTSSELREAIRYLNERFPTVRRLPAALTETYALFGNRRDLTSNQDQLLNPNGLWLDATGGVLVVRRENQGCAEWGIRVDDLDHDDPPVVMHVAGSEHGWQPYADRWSVACIEMVLFELLFTEEDLCTDMELDDRSLAIVERFAVLPVPVLPHWCLPEVRWFAGHDVYMREDAQTWLWVRARSPQALEEARRTLAG